MQKKVIISIITINLFIVIIGLTISTQINKAEGVLSILNPNQIRVYNQKGITTDQMSKIEKLEGIETVDFINREIFQYTYTYISSRAVADEQSGGEERSTTGLTIEKDNVFQQKLNYLAGSYLTGKGQMIIDQQFADVLKAAYGLENYDQLIGHKVEKKEIVGVYSKQSIADVTTTCDYTYMNVDNSRYIPRCFININNGFLTFDLGEKKEQKYEINQANTMIAYNYEQETRDFDYFIYTGDEYGNEVVDYYTSNKRGVDEGIVDPESKEYGPTFNQYATINTGENREQVVSELKTLLPEAAIVTADTKISDIQNNTSSIIQFILIAISLELLIVVPTIRNGKKK